MFNHEPSNYQCSFCNLVEGVESEYNNKQDIIYENGHALALVSPKWWDTSPGHVLVVPKHHYENIYDISDSALAEVYKLVKRFLSQYVQLIIAAEHQIGSITSWLATRMCGISTLTYFQDLRMITCIKIMTTMGLLLLKNAYLMPKNFENF